jgi:hypothetical protein
MKRKTNTEFIVDMMERGGYGALTQLVVMTAIDNYTRRIAALSLDEVREVFGEGGFVNPEAWHAASVDIQAKMQGRLT